ncbi:MAG: hypothetical protein GXY61_13855 [Lentisphaerae bacterium]|nr:hypothetical protein [Lentisphaerota bacterium]
MKTQIISTQKVSEQNRSELYELFQQFYANTSSERFLRDFSNKHWLIQMSDNGRLVGFSTQQLLELPWNGTTIRFLFSGDTIVHPDYWNQSQLAGAFGHLFLRIEAQSRTPLYWFLISKGFRTYRFLPVFFNHFYPHHSVGDASMKPLLDTVAKFMFKAAYNKQSGIIESDSTKDHLISRLAEIPSARQRNPHVQFFQRANPSYATGSELACLAPLSRSNLTRCGERVIQHTEVAWDE